MTFEQGRSDATYEITAQPHASQCLDIPGKIHNRSLVREHLMDAINVGHVIRDEFGFEFYVQMPNVAPIERTHVNEPLDYCEKTASKFDEEFEGVLLVEEYRQNVVFCTTLGPSAVFSLRSSIQCGDGCLW